MFNVELVEFVLPNGRQQITQTVLNDEYKLPYEAMLDAGFRLETEILTTGQVSVTVCHPEHGDVDIRIVPNGPEVHVAICELLSSEAWTCTLK